MSSVMFSVSIFFTILFSFLSYPYPILHFFRSWLFPVRPFSPCFFYFLSVRLP
jgi:hypothetical protein